MWKLFLIIYFISVTNLLVAQTVSISSTKVNIFAQWIDNPITIVVENNSCKNIVVKVDKGQLKGTGCDRIYTAPSDSINSVLVRIGVKKGLKITWVSEQSYRVLKLPDPMIRIGNSTGGSITKGSLYLQQRFYVPIFYDGFCSNNNPRYGKVQNYSVRVIRKDSILFSEDNYDQYLSERFKNFIFKNCENGDKVVFDNFTILIYEKEVRKVKQTIDLTLQIR